MNTNNHQIGAFIESEGGYYGGKIAVGGKPFGVIWAPKAEGDVKAAWHPSRAGVAAATSYADSITNTLAIAEAGSPLAKLVTALTINGHTDWVIPSRDVLELGYRHLKPTTRETYCSYRDGENPSSIPQGMHYTEDAPIVQTTVDAFKAGNAEAFEEAWYWSSTQYSASSAWYQYFYYGSQNGNNKSHEGRARAVRLIQLDA